jgi:hypothetical protein
MHKVYRYACTYDTNYDANILSTMPQYMHICMHNMTREQVMPKSIKWKISG